MRYSISLAGLKSCISYTGIGASGTGFSSDDFFQEEDNEEDAAEVCFGKYKVSFPVWQLVPFVVDANPVFKALGEAKGYPRWNFSKYVASDGNIVAKFRSNESPDSPKIRATLAKVLDG